MASSFSSSLHLDWCKRVLFGRTDPPDFTIVQPHGLRYAFSLLWSAIVLLLFAASTLPETRHRRAWATLRLMLWLVIVYVSVELSISPRFTLGAPIRDGLWPLLGWNVIARATDVCVASLLDEDDEHRAPRWIVPIPAASKGKKFDEDLDERNGDAKVSGTQAKVGFKDQFDAVPAQWQTLPHPPLFSWRRVLWAWDHLTLLRPGTSLALPNEQRALSWSQATLERASRDSVTHGGFGQNEGLRYVGFTLLLQAIIAMPFQHVITMPQSSTGTGADHFYSMPLAYQLFVTFCIGLAIPMPSSIIDTLLAPFVLKRRWAPRTAFLSGFHQPLFAKGTLDFWGRRWHAWVRRCAWRNARLLGGSKQGPTLNRIGAFLVTGTLHSWILIRWIRPYPPTHLHALVVGMFLPGGLALFLGQGAACAIELAVLGPPPREQSGDHQEAGWKTLLRRVWLWSTVLFMGRWYIAAIASLGMNTIESQRGAMPW